ncbi:MAG: hypothetical protein M1838_003038 [Thelocarpon superellum]|nr:MAG: hypothetical protein M1838_003038 [Thelocarpon superellum]
MSSNGQHKAQKTGGSAKPISISFGGGANKTGPSSPASKSITGSSSLTSRPITYGGLKGNVAGRGAHGPVGAQAKRRHQTLHDSDDEDDAATNQQVQLVSGFDHAAGGAIEIEDETAKKETKSALVITGLKNRDWREESRRKRGGANLLPREVQAAATAASSGAQTKMDVVNGAPQAFGLTFVKSDDADKVENENGTEHGDQSTNRAPLTAQKTDDEMALEALMTDGSGARKSNMVLPALPSAVDAGTNGRNAGRSSFGMNEDDAFKADVSSRPDMATLEDYAAVPVEEFGAALLRGMGWKEGDAVGKRKNQSSKPRLLERRPALLGIGAKEVPGGAVGDELGAWGKATAPKGGKRKIDTTYTPVLLRNSKTGEMVTEEELKGKLDEQGRKKSRGEESEKLPGDTHDRDRGHDRGGKDRERHDDGKVKRDR